MNVRKEMGEKKLSNVIRDNEVAMEKLTVNTFYFNYIFQINSRLSSSSNK